MAITSRSALAAASSASALAFKTDISSKRESFGLAAFDLRLARDLGFPELLNRAPILEGSPVISFSFSIAAETASSHRFSSYLRLQPVSI